MIGPSGFMQAPVRRRCAKCGPSEFDVRGCVTCAVLAEKYVGRYDALRRLHAAARRSRLIAANVCINAISHGPPEAGKTKCTRCLEQHRRSNR